ncbi:MAG: VWA domain-containing protein [Fibrobacteria bacterium]|nr:VWA domain-containing protein [Fibrobacteria bacterium]
MDPELKRIERLLKTGKITPAQAERLRSAVPAGKHDYNTHNKIRTRLFLLLFSVVIVLMSTVLIYQDDDVCSDWFPKWWGDTEINATEMVAPNEYSKQGRLLFQKDKVKYALPLVETKVNGTVYETVARVYVTQLFVNPTDSILEALYVFPLPGECVVDYVYLEIGDKRIRAVVKERDQARRDYEQARSKGLSASLLVEERPNIFTQHVANILPGDSVLVTMSYLQPLSYINGKFEFVFPMTIGPRYIPGTPIKPSERGLANPTGQVSDAHKITPLVLGAEYRKGPAITINLQIQTPEALGSIGCPSHKIAVDRTTKGTTRISLLSNALIQNRDFILRFSAGKPLTPGFLTERTHEKNGYFQFYLMPPSLPVPTDNLPREIVFVVDKSGSMRGTSGLKTLEIVKHALKQLRNNDTFRVYRFSDVTDALSEKALPANNENVRKALKFIEGTPARGGTVFLKALNTVISTPSLIGRQKCIVFLTDGYIGNEAAVLSSIRRTPENVRVFALGIGTSVNRYLIEGIAEAGRGFADVIRPDEWTDSLISRFFEAVGTPVLSHVSFSWDGIMVGDVLPARIPDLYRYRPLLITGKYLSADNPKVTVKGSFSNGTGYTRTIELAHDRMELEERSVSVLWAQRQAADYAFRGSWLFGKIAYTPEDVQERITSIGLAYGIMTRYTSMLALLEEIRNPEGTWMTVEQYQALPEGSRIEHFTSEYKEPVYGLSEYQVDSLLENLNNYFTNRQGDLKSPLDSSRLPNIVTDPGEQALPSTFCNVEFPKQSGIFIKAGSTLRSKKKLLRYISNSGAALQQSCVQQCIDFQYKTLLVRLQININPDGGVKSVSLETEKNLNDEFKKRLMDAVSGWTFSAAADSIDQIVIVPLVFICSRP